MSPLHGSQFPALRGSPADSSRSHEASISVKLQGVSQDILRAKESVRVCADVLQNFRSGDVFDRLSMQRRSMADQSKCRE